MSKRNTSTVLLVDDEPTVLRLLQSILELEGYKIITAFDSESALEIAATNIIDMAILDIAMPDIDGFELCNRLKKINSLYQNIPVVFISGKNDLETKLQGFELGAVDYISKPFHPKEVVARINRHFTIQQHQKDLANKAQQLKRKLAQLEIMENQVYDKYKILKLLGSGGMSYVYKVQHVNLDRFMALKIMNVSEDSLEEENVMRFQVEAQAIARINHPNVVEVYDSGILQGHPYIAMELVSGYDLERIGKERMFSFPLIHDILKQALLGITAAHEQNIIHRDIKPGNLMIDRDQVLKITDFGIAKDLRRKNITERGVMLGTPAYMSPEQCWGATIDTRSDIYSLGMTLYFLLTSEHPYPTGDTLAVVLHNLEEPLTDPRKSRKDIPEYLCNILFKMTEKNPIRRYQDTAEIIEELDKHRV